MKLLLSLVSILGNKCGKGSFQCGLVALCATKFSIHSKTSFQQTCELGL